MSDHFSATGDPVGFPVPDWRPPPRPPRAPLEGSWAVVEPLDADTHAAEIHAANTEDATGRNWTYLPYGPFPDEAAYRAWIAAEAQGDDPLFFAIRDRATGLAAGVASYLRIAPTSGAIELGHINLAPPLQRGRAGTEALVLMMRNAFALGFRRFEWKCDALNARSRRLALRLGLSFEGVFRQAAVVKGRNRDTAWYAAVDADWPAIDRAQRDWLDPANFDAEGRQRRRLSEMTRPLVRAG